MHSLFLDGRVIDQVPCASVVLGTTVSDPRSWLLSKLSHWGPSIVTHALPQALKSSVFSSPFYLLWNPAEVDQKSWKWKKIRAERDQIPPPPSPKPPEVVIGLSPYTFPQEWPFHVPEEENISGEDVLLAGLVCSSQLCCCRNKGSSMRLDDMPVPTIRRAWNTSMSPHTIGPISQCRATRPANKTNRTAILKAWQHSSGHVRKRKKLS